MSRGETEEMFYAQRFEGGDKFEGLTMCKKALTGLHPTVSVVSLRLLTASVFNGLLK